MTLPSPIQLKKFEEIDLIPLAHTFCAPWRPLETSLALWFSYFEEQKAGLRTVLILKTQEKYVGYGSLLYPSTNPLFMSEGIPEIADLWIGDRFRKQGQGKRLIQALEHLAKETGYTRIGIGVGLYQDYAHAQRLYFSLGYKPTLQGITYKALPAVPGQSYCVDDDLLLWLSKNL